MVLIAKHGNLLLIPEFVQTKKSINFKLAAVHCSVKLAVHLLFNVQGDKRG
jgi:hypothetical protein